MLGGDPVCLHRAAYWYAQGVLELDPEPEPPASAAPAACWQCNGYGEQWYRRGYALPCPACHGAGVAPLVAQAAALLIAAAETCDHCGGALDDDAETDDALQTLCGACVEACREDAAAASRAAVSAAHAQHVAERAGLAPYSPSPEHLRGWVRPATTALGSGSGPLFIRILTMAA